MSEHAAEELLRRLKQWQDTAAADLLGEFDAVTLCRVSLLPEWTPALAAELAAPGDLDTLVGRLGNADLIECRRAPGANGAIEAFWVRSRRRREIGDHLRRQLGGERLLDEYDRFWLAVDALDARAELEPELEQWLEVRGFHLDSSGTRLLALVEARLREDDLAGAALTVATARVVSDVIGGALEDSVKRAQWRLDREYRTRDDLAHLDGYHRRAEIEDVLVELVRGRSGRWAAHLLGDAGVGKTMTVRYLASGRLAADHGMERFPVARVDFDHLDPRYPERRPAELLVAMTDELLGFATTRRAEHGYRAVRDAADALHEELSRSYPDPATMAELREQAIGRFADLVLELPPPVVLVLDTCEELAKLYAVGASAPAIEQTFDLLERLHTRAPDVRVLFAGRRWLVKPPEDGTPFSGPRLEPRDYVRVAPMRGFTRADAEGYLDEREVPERLRPSLLERSADGGRYNPFELAGLCDWARDEPGLDLAELAATVVDPYVERRILSRIQNRNVTAALPVAVALAAFDRALITPALSRAGVDVAAAFDGLSAQEWVTVRSVGSDGRPHVIEIDEHLRERLRAVLERSPGRAVADLPALGRDAAAVIKRTPLPEVATETVVAAVRLLPPSEAAELWDWIDEEVLRRGEWAWAMQVVPRVSAMEKARAGEWTILAAVFATEASARIHSGRREGLGDLWANVVTWAERHPDSRRRLQLTDRGNLGEFAVSESIGVIESAALLSDSVVGGYANRSSDALLSACENIVAGRDRTELPPFVVNVLEYLVRNAGSARISAGAAILLAGLWLQRRIDQSVEALLESVIDALSQEQRQETDSLADPPVWRDWVAPRGLRERARLMRVLLALYGGEPLDETRWRDWRTRVVLYGDIDVDRLRAALLDYEVNVAAQRADLPRIEYVRLSGQRVPWLHHGFARPLAVAVADAMSLRGRYDEAAESLREYRKQAVGEGDQAETIDACDLALLRLCRLTMNPKYAPVLSLGYDGTPRLRDEAWLVQRLLGKAVGDDWRRECSEIGRWRCDPQGESPAGFWSWAADHLDFWEAAYLESWANRSTLGVVASARGALKAGQIHAVLGQFSDARPLLVTAAESLAAGGYSAAVEVVHRLLARDPLADVADPSRWERFADWVRTRPGVVAEAVRNVRHRLRRIRLSRTIGQFAFWLGGGGLFAALVAGFAGLLGASPGVVFSGFAVLTLLFLAAPFVDFGRNIAARRMVVTQADGERLSLTAYSHPPDEFDRPARIYGNRKRFRTPSWTREFDLESLSEVGPIANPLLSVEVVVVLLEMSRELHCLVPWEQQLGMRLRPRQVPQVVWVRWMPGRRSVSMVVEWKSRGDTFLGPVWLSPSRLWIDQPGPQRLMHLVGTPVRTSAGWQFRLRDTIRGAASESSRGAGSREELLDVHELTRERVGLVVLQAEPTDGIPLPLGADRDGFVRTASAAMDNAADAVLVLPPLPDELARDAIEIVWRAVGTSRVLSVQTLISVVADLKMMVYKAEGETPIVCLDVLLFLRSSKMPKGSS